MDAQHKEKLDKKWSRELRDEATKGEQNDYIDLKSALGKAGCG